MRTFQRCIVAALAVGAGIFPALPVFAANAPSFDLILAPACIRPALTDDSITFTVVNAGTENETIKVMTDNPELLSPVSQFTLPAGQRIDSTVYINGRTANAHVSFVALTQATAGSAKGFPINRGVGASVIFNGSRSCYIAPKRPQTVLTVIAGHFPWEIAGGLLAALGLAGVAFYAGTRVNRRRPGQVVKAA